jgi:hypothetical protein
MKGCAVRDTSHIGNVCQAKVLAALLARSEKVLVPFGDGCHYDLLIDRVDGFVRVQCKSGILKKGAVMFKNFTVCRDGKHRSYGDSVDAYGVYCASNGKTYLVPSAECGSAETSLRVEDAKNGMHKGVRLAVGFEI